MIGAPLFGVGAGGQKVHQEIDYDLTGDLPSALTFIRASIATKINSSGLIENVVSGESRVEYNPATLNLMGLLIEPESTNLLLYSEDFNHAEWVKTTAIASNVSAISPMGIAGATTFVDDGSTGSGNAIIKDALTLPTANTEYEFSVFAKVGTESWLGIGTQTFAGGTSYFDLANGVVGNVSGAHTAGMEVYPNGWYRCWIRFDPLAILSGSVRFLVAEGDGDVTFELDGTHSILAWGAQLEENRHMTSYIPTNGATVTRNAERLEETSVTWFNTGGDGTVIVNASLPARVFEDWATESTVTLDLLTIGDGTFDESVRLVSRADKATEEMRCKLTTGGVTTNVNSLLAFNWIHSTDTEIFAKWTNAAARLFLDGIGQAAAVSDPKVPAALNKLSIGHTHNNTFQWRGHIKRVRYFDAAQADPS